MGKDDFTCYTKSGNRRPTHPPQQNDGDMSFGTPGANEEAEQQDSFATAGLIQNPPTRERAETQTPGDKVGLVIGRGGETIKYIQRECNVKITRDQSDLPDGKRNATISGSQDAIERAKELISEIVQPRQCDSFGGGSGGDSGNQGYGRGQQHVMGADSLNWRKQLENGAHDPVKDIQKAANAGQAPDYFQESRTTSSPSSPAPAPALSNPLSQDHIATPSTPGHSFQQAEDEGAGRLAQGNLLAGLEGLDAGSI
ncbi:hypothetical protein HK097_008898 [Rhizophlyctis rosea]|uniref:K Homology domain-containing protein n=1 Tax=Rhizophlyctis rosea TaxID=64517 RepID=A0AAD5SCQ5_9FUNG|nr:hypothetical protein HK097_008898 [Rhizophlyctis rosea]